MSATSSCHETTFLDVQYHRLASAVLHLANVEASLEVYATFLLKSFLFQITRRARLGISDVLVAIIIVERLQARRMQSRGVGADTFCSCCKIVVGALMLANKLMIDDAYTIRGFWSHATVYDKPTLKRIELELLQRLGYNLYVMPTEYERLVQRLQYELQVAQWRTDS